MAAALPASPLRRRMPPTTSPEFDALHRALPEIRWLSNTGKTTTIALPLPYRFADTASEAHASIAAPDWENWTLERRNELTAFLSDRFPARDAEGSAIARMARRIVDEEVAPASARALTDLPPAATAALTWDVANALMEAAYRDCRPPLFFTHLVEVYRAGHLPVGWEVKIRTPTIPREIRTREIRAPASRQMSQEPA